MTTRPTKRALKRKPRSLVPFTVLVRAGQEVVTMPVLVVSEANSREHWRVKHARKKRQQMTIRMCLPLVRHLSHVTNVRMTRIGSRKLDTDNLASAFKTCRDQLAWWLGVDDGDERVTWECDQITGAKKHGIIVTFTEAQS